MYLDSSTEEGKFTVLYILTKHLLGFSTSLNCLLWLSSLQRNRNACEEEVDNRAYEDGRLLLKFCSLAQTCHRLLRRVFSF